MSPESDHKRVPLGPVLLVNFIGTMGFTIVVPFLVFLVTRLGGNAVLYGLIAATYPAFQFIGSPILGRWSDRYGRRRILLLSQAGTLLSWLVFAAALWLPLIPLLAVDSSVLGQFTLTLPLLAIIAARALDGLTGGNISVANAYVADISRPEERNANFGKMGVAANLGVVLGPALASVLGATALQELLPVLAATAIAALGTVLIAVALPESNPRVARAQVQRREAGKALGQETRCALRSTPAPGLGVRALLRQPHIAFLMTLYFVILLSFNFFYTAFPIRAAELGWSVLDMGVFFASLSAMLVLVEGPLLSQLAWRVSERTLIVTGLLVLGTNFALMSSRDTAVLYLAAALFALGNGIMWPSIVSVVSKLCEARLQGEVQGLAGSAGSLAAITGLILGGVAYSTLGASTFLISAALAYLSFVMALRIPRIVPATEPGA